jgi:hypothetical protein
MSYPEKPHLSNATLSRSERLQQKFGNNRLGRAATRLAVGSRSPAYRQSIWRSESISALVLSTVKVPGDPSSGKLARNWDSALVMAVTDDDYAKLEKQVNHREPFEDAIAYISEDVVHVGTQAIREGHLFAYISAEDLAVAMRIGRGPLEATMGLWLPEQRAFVGAENVHIVEAKLPVNELPSKCPGLHLT